MKINPSPLKCIKWILSNLTNPYLKSYGLSEYLPYNPTDQKNIREKIDQHRGQIKDREQKVLLELQLLKIKKLYDLPLVFNQISAHQIKNNIKNKKRFKAKLIRKLAEIYILTDNLNEIKQLANEEENQHVKVYLKIKMYEGYKKLKDQAKANEMVQKISTLIKLQKQKSNQNSNLSMLYYLIGNIYIREKQYQKALQTYLKMKGSYEQYQLLINIALNLVKDKFFLKGIQKTISLPVYYKTKCLILILKELIKQKNFTEILKLIISTKVPEIKFIGLAILGLEIKNIQQLKNNELISYKKIRKDLLKY